MNRPMTAYGSTRAATAVQCQGCGRVSNTAKVGDPHNCWRNEDGTYEEGGTFQ